MPWAHPQGGENPKSDASCQLHPVVLWPPAGRWVSGTPGIGPTHLLHPFSLDLDFQDSWQGFTLSQSITLSSSWSEKAGWPLIWGKKFGASRTIYTLSGAMDQLEFCSKR